VARGERRIRGLRWRTIKTWSLLASVTAIVAMGTLASCRDINTNPTKLAAVSFDTLPFPAVVAGDSLRDTLGVARPLHGNAFNIQGDSIPGFPIRYRILDTGATVDSITGYVIGGDSALPTGLRVLTDASGLQSQTMLLYVVRRPDTLVYADSIDSLAYSFSDSSVNVSHQLSVQPLNITNGTTFPVPSWVVSFAIVYHPPLDPSAAPGADTLVAQLVGANGSPARSATGDATSGIAGLGIRIRPQFLKSFNDSVVVMATAKYRGVPLRGSPKRLVLYIKS
jgi:hypothetical protein